MFWLNKIADELEARNPHGEIVVSSGVSPSGTYHLGTLREVLTAEAILRVLKQRGREVRHIHVVDDLDVFRKVPADVSDEFSEHLGKPLCEVPAPDGSDISYADYFLKDLLHSAEPLNLEMEVMRAHEAYRRGLFTEAIEEALSGVKVIRTALEEISGRKLDDQWSPIQVLENGRLKNRKFIAISPSDRTIQFETPNGDQKTVRYDSGEVKLNWRIDWPARWWKIGVDAEPFGRDHGTKGGSYDTGVEIARNVYKTEPPFPIPYNFINRTGDTKKMSKSAGDAVTAVDLLSVLPAEIVWYFIIRYAPDKLLFFDTEETLMKLFDEFSELASKSDRSTEEEQLLELCVKGIDEKTVSRIPFTHLVASYQASLKDVDKTLEVIMRTEHRQTAEEDAEIIKKELIFIDEWLKKWAPEEVKFELISQPPTDTLNDTQKEFLQRLADKIAAAPKNVDGEWFHKVIYEFKESHGLQPKELFTTLYAVLIGKQSGPRAGWFLSLLPRDWLVERLRLKA